MIVSLIVVFNVDSRGSSAWNPLSLLPHSQALPTSSFCFLAVCNNGGRKPGESYHVIHGTGVTCLHSHMTRVVNMKYEVHNKRILISLYLLTPFLRILQAIKNWRHEGLGMRLSQSHKKKLSKLASPKAFHLQFLTAYSNQSWRLNQSKVRHNG